MGKRHWTSNRSISLLRGETQSLTLWIKGFALWSRWEVSSIEYPEMAALWSLQCSPSRVTPSGYKHHRICRVSCLGSPSRSILSSHSSPKKRRLDSSQEPSGSILTPWRLSRFLQCSQNSELWWKLALKTQLTCSKHSNPSLLCKMLRHKESD